MQRVCIRVFVSAFIGTFVHLPIFLSLLGFVCENSVSIRGFVCLYILYTTDSLAIVPYGTVCKLNKLQDI